MSETKLVEMQQKLAQTRGALMVFLQGLEAAQWHTAVQSEDAAWAVIDVVRHLANAERGMTGLIEQFKLGKDPVPPDFDRERYNKRAVEKAKDKTPANLLADMEANRTRLFDVMQTLEPDDWQKNGRHASLKIMTIEEVCHTIADHESWHLQEMQQALKE